MVPNTPRLLGASALVIGACMAFATPAWSVGSDSFGEEKPPEKTQTSKDCKKGEIFDKKAQKCVKAKDAMLAPDVLYDAARELAYFGRPDEALALLAKLPQDDPNVLNYKGYATRKAGRLEEGMAYYRQAIALAPDHVLARSYMGQALAQMGDLDGAREQLQEIRKRAGTVNYAYVSLSQTLRGAPSDY